MELVFYKESNLAENSELVLYNYNKDGIKVEEKIFRNGKIDVKMEYLYNKKNLLQCVEFIEYNNKGNSEGKYIYKYQFY